MSNFKVTGKNNNASILITVTESDTQFYVVEICPPETKLANRTRIWFLKSMESKKRLRSKNRPW